MPDFDVIGAGISGAQPSGLLTAFTPGYQVDQAKAALARQQVQQSQLFRDGLPTDGNGNTDWGAAYQKAMQGGAYDLADKLIGTGIRMSSLNDRSTLDNPTGQTGGAAVGPGGGSTGGVDPLDAYAHSIGTIESSNRYDAVGPAGKNGAAPLGRYQVMSSNVGPWTKEVLGQAMSPSDFLANPQAQDAVFRAKFGQSLQQYGNPFDAASIWFSGKPLNRAGNASDSLGTTVPAYVRKFAAGLGPAAAALRGGQGQGTAPVQAAQGSGPSSGVQPVSFAPAVGGGAIAPAAGGDDYGRPQMPPTANPAPAASLAYSPLAGFGRVLSSGQPITDSQVGMARGFVNAAQNLDPRTMTPDQQNAVTAATEIVSRYEGQAGRTASGAPAPDGDTPRGNVHPYAMGAGGAPLATNSGQAAGPAPTALKGPGMSVAPPTGGALPISFGAPGAVGTPQPQPGAPPAVGAPSAPPAVGGSTAAPASGPDLPNLPAGFQEPGGGTRYVNAVLGKAAQFAAAGDPRAKVWEDRAKQVQAQLEAAQTFRNNLSLAQARADDRYNAANSPGAIAAAGAKAGAEATARNALSLVPSVQPDGSTIMIPQSDALAAAQGGKPIVSAQPGYVTTGQGNLLAKITDGSRAYQERQVASQRLDALSSLLETYQTGANSTAFNEAAANAKSLGISIPTSATLNPAAMQEFAKDGYANVLSSMKEQGNKQYAAEVSAAVNSNPNPDLQPEANAAMIAQMQGTKRWYDQNFRDYSQWYHGNKGASDDADFQTSWTDAHPLGAYVAAAGKDIAPVGIPQPAPGKLVDGQAYMTAGGKMRWSASAGRMVPFGSATAPALGGGGAPPTASRAAPSAPSAAPVQGARQARDGNWYTPDPNRPGKFLMVTR